MSQARATLQLGSREIDLDRGLVLTPEAEIALTTLQRKVLQLLVAGAGKVVSREALLAGVWGTKTQRGATRPVDALVHKLREVLEDDPGEPRYLLTVRGQGYRLKLATARTNLEQTLALPSVAQGPLDLVLRSSASPGWTQIVGPPGSGKTTLAKAACRALAERLPGGAWWLDCGGAADADALLADLARLLSARTPDAEGVLAALGKRTALALFLDGLEQVAHLEELLSKLSQDGSVRLIGTSQRLLGHPGTTVVLPEGEGREVPTASLARSWASCTAPEQRLLSCCLRFTAPFPAEALVEVADVPASLVSQLTERWLLVAVQGRLDLLPALRTWLGQQGLLPTQPDAAFVRYCAGARGQDRPALTDLFAALHEGLALELHAETASLIEAVLERSQSEHEHLASAVARALAQRPPQALCERLQIAAGHLAVLGGDRARAQEARAQAIALGLDRASWPLRALEAAMGPLLCADAHDPGPDAPQEGPARIAWSRLAGVAAVEAGQEVQQGLLWLRRSRSRALERGDRVSVLLAEGDTLTAMVWTGAPREPAAVGREKLAQELLSLGASHAAAEGLLAASSLWAALGERSRAQPLLAQALALATDHGFAALQRRASLQAICLDLACAPPEALLEPLAALREALQRLPCATTEAGLAYAERVTRARAGQRTQAPRESHGRHWDRALAALGALLDPDLPLPSEGPLPGHVARSIVLYVAHRRGAPLTDRRAREDVRCDPLVIALCLLGLRSGQVGPEGGDGSGV